ncbi:hypothetical protein KR200_002506 [Drosophila serrata]|nr:hypothetical protein KR200_002506 [Drosophila serrata]
MELESIDKFFSAYQKNGVSAGKRADELERENFDVQDLETGQHSQAVQRVQAAEMKAEDLQHRLLSEQPERARLERLVTEGSIPDDQKVASLISCNGAVSPGPELHHPAQLFTLLQSCEYWSLHGWLLIDRVVQQVVLQVDQRPSSDLISDPDPVKCRWWIKCDDSETSNWIAANTKECDHRERRRLQPYGRVTHTKSSAAKGTTLLQYLVQVIESKFMDPLELEDHIPYAREASKVSLGEMDKDIQMLRTGLADVAREIEFHRTLPFMREFHASASVHFAELEDKFQDIKTRFDHALRLFGEDGSQKRARLEHLVTEYSIPDGQKVAGLTGCNGAV